MVVGGVVDVMQDDVRDIRGTVVVDADDVAADFVGEGVAGVGIAGREHVVGVVEGPGDGATTLLSESSQGRKMSISTWEISPDAKTKHF